MRIKSAMGLLVAAISIGAMLSCVSSSSGGATGTGFVWIATEGDQQVRAFNINSSSGSVSQVGSARATGVSPVALALTPDGKSLSRQQFRRDSYQLCGSQRWLAWHRDLNADLYAMHSPATTLPGRASSPQLWCIAGRACD